MNESIHVILQIFFEAARGSSETSDIAIDNVIVNTQSCGMFNCTTQRSQSGQNKTCTIQQRFLIVTSQL